MRPAFSACVAKPVWWASMSAERRGSLTRSGAYPRAVDGGSVRQHALRDKSPLHHHGLPAGGGWGPLPVAAGTRSGVLMARETVMADTPASRATSRRVKLAGRADRDGAILK